MSVFDIIGLYFAIGLVALCILDITTGRIRKRLKLASYDTQEALAGAGSPVGTRISLIVTVIVLWIFWVVAIYSALRSLKGKKDEGD